MKYINPDVACISRNALVSDINRIYLKEKEKLNMVLAFGAILDPRIKLSTLEFLYSKVESDALKCQKKMDLVKTKLYKLFDQYSNMNNTSSSQPQSSTTHTLSQSVGVKGKNKRIFDEMMAYESQTIISAGKSQLDLYLEEPKLEFAYYQDLDILEHWKNQKHRYPTLALMACDVLAIPISTVALESAFSIDKDNEDNASIKTTFSKQESNTLEEDINEEKGGKGGSEEIDVDDVIDEI
ncbi:hypothetical protein ZIOFF_021143 [Zingiber officinale]|uniref:HAT C-terminal dimerisation domain-containing protein n=1 Tax=Zingiber officinale TaxID=94328 RepID=A0A8J5LGX1_ZINOF|nr:hypothetical protein ZIOFF_021143 [Zingiber officinale]